MHKHSMYKFAFWHSYIQELNVNITWFMYVNDITITCIPFLDFLLLFFFYITLNQKSTTPLNM